MPRAIFLKSRFLSFNHLRVLHCHAIFMLVPLKKRNPSDEKCFTTEQHQTDHGPTTSLGLTRFHSWQNQTGVFCLVGENKILENLLQVDVRGHGT